MLLAQIVIAIKTASAINERTTKICHNGKLALIYLISASVNAIVKTVAMIMLMLKSILSFLFGESRF